MWIEPNGVVKILKDIPLDNKYNNTIHFYDDTAQYNYFNSKTKYTYNKISYQRTKRNYMRVEINAENLYDCNYLMFQNTSFGNKWFYAFITKVEYVANTVSSIEYEIDVMQTWFYDCTMKECFVEREHSETDEIGDNLIDEGLELGEYVMHFFTPSYATLHFDRKLLANQVIIVACSFDDNYGDFTGNAVNKIFSGLNYKWFHCTEDGIAQLITFIEDVLDHAKQDGIIDIFQVPEAFILSIQEGRELMPYTFNWGDTKPLANIDGYYPKNKKLFTYPYNFLYVTDGHGNSAEFPYEYFDGENFNFEYTMTMSCDPSMMISPIDYKGIVGTNYNEKMVYKGFPHCSWNNDMWKTWLAQNGGSLFAVATPLASSLVGVGAGIVSGNTLAVAGGVVGVLNTLKQTVVHAAMPAQSRGNYNGDVIYSSGINDFWYGGMHIRSEFAKIIDEFFTTFGYATRRLKVPNINSRPHWNYVKTIDANIIGSVPSDDLQQIISIFNKGITFWKNGDEVGEYTLDNSPQ